VVYGLLFVYNLIFEPTKRASGVFVRKEGRLCLESSLQKENLNLEEDLRDKKAPVNDRLKRILEACRYNPNKAPAFQLGVRSFREEKESLEMVHKMKEDRNIFRLNTSRLNATSNTLQDRMLSPPPTKPLTKPPPILHTPVVTQKEDSFPPNPAIRKRVLFEPSDYESTSSIPTPPVLFPSKKRVIAMEPTRQEPSKPLMPSIKQEKIDEAPLFPSVASRNTNQTNSGVSFAYLPVQKKARFLDFGPPQLGTPNVPQW